MINIIKNYKIIVVIVVLCFSFLIIPMVKATALEQLKIGVSENYDGSDVRPGSIFVRAWGAGGFIGERESVVGWIGYIISILITFLGLIFLGMSIYAGSTWMLARGNPEKVDKAKEVLRTSMIGIVILILAYVISNFITYLLIQSGGY